jgi:hypothetical protein
VSDTTESQLVLKAQAGDRQALGELLSRHRETIFAMAMRILQNRTDAADATQETWQPKPIGYRLCRWGAKPATRST